MLPLIAESNVMLKSLSDEGLIDAKIGVGNVNVDEEGDLKMKYKIARWVINTRTL